MDYFVTNRVAEIQTTLPEAHWHHIDTRSNPADCASRGILPRALHAHPLWWQGPTILRQTSSTWPPSKDSPSFTTRLEERSKTQGVATMIATVNEPWDLIHRFSSASKLFHVTAWCYWFIHKIQSRLKVSGAPVSVESHDCVTTIEVDRARIFWMKEVQRNAFSKDSTILKAQGALSRKSPLARLSLFLDEDGLMRVGGRLKHSLLDFDERHPIILPRTSPLTTLIVRQSHLHTLHGGPQLTLSHLRRQYWIIRGRQVVKGVIHRCLRCFKWRAQPLTPQMSSLPRPRVVPSRAFLHTGVDYASPVLVRTSKGRGHKAHKAYIAIFVCLSSRAAHIELVSDYSSEAFIAAFRRFATRRGLCSNLYSDCGTTFVGADAELRRLFQADTQHNASIRHQLSAEGTQWHFNPPAAPHFGGIWEAAVKLAKHHMRRALGSSTLTFEEMSIFLTQVEACLNSRPLQALTDDSMDVTALIPGHLLIGAPLLSVPSSSLIQQPVTHLSHWQHMQQIHEHFWRRWSQEYIHALQSRPKWQQPQPVLHVEDLCLIRNELLPPNQWPLGRVVTVHPGSDGQARVATLRTATSTLTRPLIKLRKLPAPEY